jgi:hypothetical protein
MFARSLVVVSDSKTRLPTFDSLPLGSPLPILSFSTLLVYAAADRLPGQTLWQLASSRDRGERSRSGHIVRGGLRGRDLLVQPVEGSAID